MKDLLDSDVVRFRVPHPFGPMPVDLMPFSGFFHVPYKHPVNNKRSVLKVMASRACCPAAIGEPSYWWDHVSVSIKSRSTPPNWNQMCFIKDLFFLEGETVMQLHPGDEYINNHPGCLHLWRPHERSNMSIPRPPSILVGVPELNPC